MFVNFIHNLIDIRLLHLCSKKNNLIKTVRGLISKLKSSLSNAQADTRDDVTYTRTHIIYTPRFNCKIN